MCGDGFGELKMCRDGFGELNMYGEYSVDEDHTRMEICIMPYGGQHLFVRFCSVSNFLLGVGVLFYFLVVF